MCPGDTGGPAVLERTIERDGEVIRLALASVAKAINVGKRSHAAAAGGIGRGETSRGGSDRARIADTTVRQGRGAAGRFLIVQVVDEEALIDLGRGDLDGSD